MKKSISNELKEEIKDIVINKLLNQVQIFFNLALNYKQENQILKINLIESLKHIFLIKTQYNISVPLGKIMNKQSITIKNKINQSIQETFPNFEELKSNFGLNHKTIINSYNQKINKAMTPYKTIKKNNNINNFERNRKKSRPKSQNNNNSVNILNNNTSFNYKKDLLTSTKMNSLSNLDKDESKDSIYIFQTKNLPINEKPRKKNYKKPQLNINNYSNNSTSGSSIFKVNKTKPPKNDVKKKKIFKRDVSLPKLPLNQLINLNI